MDLYGLLKTLVLKSDLTITEKGDSLAVLENLEKLNAFGAAGKAQAQRHQCSVVLETGKCSHCDTQMQEPRKGPNRWR